METAKESIISIATENRTWRWITVFLSAITICSVLTTYYLLHQPQQVWMVGEDRRISTNKENYFNWEIEKAAQNAVESYYLPHLNRENLINHYFDKSLIESVNKFRARDRFIVFKVNKTEENNSKILVQGTLYRENEKEEPLNLVFDRSERSETNPFGLIVSSASTKSMN